MGNFLGKAGTGTRWICGSRPDGAPRYLYKRELGRGIYRKTKASWAIRCDVSLMLQIERQPRWVGIPARVFAFTFLLTLLSFAVALLISILGTIIYSQIEHVAPNLVFAYKHIAFPIALSAGGVVLMVSLAVEMRNYRQNKILAAIERTAALNR